jgi:hypothetical protein
VIGNAIHVMRIASGEIEETTTEDGKNAAAVVPEAGKQAAKRRKQIATKAVKPRWK